MAGSDRVLTRTIQNEPRLETRNPTKRAKWRSSMSAYTSVLENGLDTADIVRDGDFSPVMENSTWICPTTRELSLDFKLLFACLHSL